MINPRDSYHVFITEHHQTNRFPTGHASRSLKPDLYFLMKKKKHCAPITMITVLSGTARKRIK